MDQSIRQSHTYTFAVSCKATEKLTLQSHVSIVGDERLIGLTQPGVVPLGTIVTNCRFYPGMVTVETTRGNKLIDVTISGVIAGDRVKVLSVTDGVQTYGKFDPETDESGLDAGYCIEVLSADTGTILAR